VAASAVFQAFLGALLALGCVFCLRLFFLRSGARRAGGVHAAKGNVGPGEARRIEEGLRRFAQEVEERLDAKLDRLEDLVKEARGLVERLPAGAARPAAPRSVPAEVAPGDPLSAVSVGDRERVLQLAAMGKVPEQIAESVGLLRGEVDLILRLHRSAARTQEN
jgi:hypothetical protein